MSAHAYSEDQLVEQPAIALFGDLGWQTVSAMEEVFGASGTLGRETSGEVVLVPRLRAALERLNPQLRPEAITSSVDELARDRSAMTLAGANREVCTLLKDGVKVVVPDRERSGSRNIEVIFRDLLALTGVLTEEQGRHLREHLSEEELTIFDILTRPGPPLTTDERNEVKKVARQLLERLNALLVLGWRQKAQARAGVRLVIEDGLDEGLPRAYTKETYQAKCNVLFEHVYESYMGDGKSSYTEAAYGA